VAGGARTEITTEIVGSRADGAILVCDGYTNPDNEWSRDNYRFEVPPFGLPSRDDEDTPLGPKVRITADGWELGWSENEGLLSGRRQAGAPVLSWNAADAFGDESPRTVARILDVIGRPPQGGAWVAIKRERRVYAVLFPLDSQNSQAQVLAIWDEETGQDIDIRFMNASGDLLAYRVINHSGEAIDDGTFLNSVVRILHLESGQYWSFHDNGPVTVRHLVNKASLMLRLPNRGGRDFKSGWPHAPARVFIHFPETGIVERHDLIISRELTVLHREEQSEESYVRLASIIERDGRWTLEVCVVEVHASLAEIKSRTVNVIELAGEVVCWSRSDDYVVLAYACGRIEARCCRRPETVAAVCYTTGQPDDVIVVRRPERTFLVVSQGGRLTWYKFEPHGFMP
jgi:hypothetical protein